MPVLVTGIHVFMPPHANDCRQRSDKTIVAGNNNKRTGTQKRLQIAPQPSNISASITRYAAAQA